MKFISKKTLALEWIVPPKDDPDGPEPPHFQIKPLTNIEKLELEDLLFASAHQQKREGVQVTSLRFTKNIVLFLLKKGMVSWRGMPEEIEWSKDVMENIGIMDQEAMSWLASEIYHKSTLTEDDKKKS